MELSEGRGRTSGWELNNIARLHESYFILKKKQSREVRAHLK